MNREGGHAADQGLPYIGKALWYLSALLLRLLGRTGIFPFKANLAPLIFHLVDHMLGNGGLGIGGHLHRKSPLSGSRLQGRQMHCTRQMVCKSVA
ncbi:hypothetical protein ATY78_22560 [Rhizobium sp. R635]|uniref:hypothetical protein n=1 Tax=unclassified Rhizobium TaxID=2613769 RepID=UPI000B6B0FE1|nr:hypothetical protein [Rhizobium sp. R635]OWV88084.1 hypothetical protein ATY78_22560 [Rhizobium sp. R635]